MFKRKIYNDLLEWKNRSNGETALLIEGARRIGKTTIVEEFGKNEYEEYVIIDFSIVNEEIEPIFNKIFSKLINIDDFYSELFLYLGKPVLPRGSLIIFDEIQFYVKARQAIKHLVKDGRYHFIETGSLISIKENVEGILIPSEEESIEMFPMDYEEFLWAIDKKFEADIIKDSYNNRKKVSDNSHQVLMSTYRLYMAVGGMPQAVKSYIDTKDFYEVDRAKKEILKIYEADLKKIDKKYGTICSLVWKNLPSMLSRHSSKFVVSKLNVRSDSILLQNTIDKLIESKIVIVNYKCYEPQIGFSLSKDMKSFKIYYNDIGLFTSIVYSKNTMDKENIYKRIIFNKLSANFGVLYENACAQTLYTLGYEAYFYIWNELVEEKKVNYEIDFLIYKNGHIIPFEVKSNKPISYKSIDRLKTKYGKIIGEKYIVEPKPLKYGDNITFLPSYMLFCI